MLLMILERKKKKEIIKFFNTSIDFFVDRWVILSNTLASSIVNLFSLVKFDNSFQQQVKSISDIGITIK